MDLENMTLIEEASSEVVSDVVSAVAEAGDGFFGTFFQDFGMGFVNFFKNIGDIDWDAVMEVLKIMGLGMVGIFVVTLTIIAVVTILNKSTSKPKKDKNTQ